MTNDGGPAFPVIESHPVYGTRVDGGMSLRDYFAGQALAAILTHESAYEHSGESQVARMAYMQADAMLAIRNEEADAVAMAQQIALGLGAAK